jgi:hypothetical protein
VLGMKINTCKVLVVTSQGKNSWKTYIEMGKLISKFMLNKYALRDVEWVNLSDRVK